MRSLPEDATTICTLLRELDGLPGDYWIRLLYTHPAHWSQELIRAIAASSKVARYVDMPLQHIDDEMLGLMRRETSRRHIEDLISSIRAEIPGITLRTTFIVGFPGETDAHFEELLRFIRAVRFERLGVFTYSREEGSRAAKMPGQVPSATKLARYRRAMALQQEIAREHAQSLVGKELKALVEQPLVARSEGDAPEVDTRILLNRPAPVGEFVRVRVTGTQVYDLRADPV